MFPRESAQAVPADPPASSRAFMRRADRRMLIDGRLVEAEQVFPSINPATEEVIAEAAECVCRRRRTGHRRGPAGLRRDDLVDRRQVCAPPACGSCARRGHNREDLRALTIAEVGCPIGMTTGAGLEGPIEIVDYYAELAEKYEPSTDLGFIEAYGSQHRRWIEREPYGVVGAISAYNYPTQLNLAKLAPGVGSRLHGRVKGAPDTPLITLALGKLIAENTDIPAGVVSVLTSSKVETGVVMTTDPNVDMITFTGSTAVGKAITVAASDTLKKTFLELGGKSACLVLDDESIDFGRDDGGDGDVLARRAGMRHPVAPFGAAHIRRCRGDGQGDDGRPQRR